MTPIPLDTGLPATAPQPTRPNVYLWAPTGELIAEMQNLITHPPLNGMHVTDIFPVNPAIEVAWEAAQSGAGMVWWSQQAEHGDGTPVLCAFAPFAPHPCGIPVMIIGYSIPVDSEVIDWMKAQGITVVAHGRKKEE